MSTRSQKLINLQEEISACRHCRNIFTHKPAPVTWGNADASIAHISQAPSKTVHETGKPFNDISGKRLREWYEISDEDFYNEDNFYITAISHCFPGKGKKGGDLKPPVVCADKWLFKELALVNNSIYIIVGKYAADYLFPGEKFRDLVFGDRKLNGKPAYILPHPSPLNIKWLKDNPEFLDKKMPVIRHAINEAINKTQSKIV